MAGKNAVDRTHPACYDLFDLKEPGEFLEAFKVPENQGLCIGSTDLFLFTKPRRIRQMILHETKGGRRRHYGSKNDLGSEAGAGF